MSSRFAAVVVLILLLSGCSTPPVATPAPSQASTPTSTPTATGAAAPSPTVPLACSGLFSDEDASALVGEAVVAVADAQLLDNPDSVAAHQAGELECAWNPPGEIGGYSGHALTLSVIDRGDDAFAARPSSADSPACNVGVDFSSCETQLLANGYWARLSFNSRTVGTNSGRPSEAVEADWISATEKLRAALANAGSPLSPWEAPTSSLASNFCATHSPLTTYGITDPSALAALRAVETCQTDDGWVVGFIRGGAWALPIMASATPPADKELGGWTPFQVAGADVALRACGEYCIAFVAIGGSAFSVSSGAYAGGDTEGKFDDAARALLAEIVAAG